MILPVRRVVKLPRSGQSRVSTCAQVAVRAEVDAYPSLSGGTVRLRSTALGAIESAPEFVRLVTCDQDRVG